MKVENGELIATAAQLVATPGILDLPVGLLNRIPRVRSNSNDEKAVKTFFDGAQNTVAALYRSVLATLADPARIGVFHYMLGEESLTRAILAWGPATGKDGVLMANVEDRWAIRTFSADMLTDSLAAILLEDIPLSSSPIRAAMSQDSLMVWMGVMHVLRTARLQALLDYRPAPVAFSTEAVALALENSGLEDSRWPIFFANKLLPFAMNGVPWQDHLADCLKDLEKRGFLERPKQDKNLWMLTLMGYQLAVADSQILTKAGLRVTEGTSEDLKAHETFLLQRSVQDLILYDLGGKEGVISSISIDELRVLVSHVLTPSDAVLKPRPSTTSAPGSLASVGTDATKQQKVKSPAQDIGKHCHVCGAVMRPTAKFCPQCGTRAEEKAKPDQCTQCGNKLAPGAKFCSSCGTPV